MKKLFSIFAALVAAVAMNATQVTFDFTSTANWTAWGFTLPTAGQGTSLDGASIVKDGVTISFVKGTGSTTCRIYQGSGTTEGKYDARLYAGDVMTISVAGSDKINKIELGVSVTLVGGTAAATHTFDPAVASAQFSSKATLKQVTVTINESGAGSTVTADTIGVTAARALIDAGTGLTNQHYIYGIITSIANTDAQIANYKNCNVYMRDLVNVTDTMEMYKSKGLNGADYTGLADVPFAEGDTVMFLSNVLKKYNSTYETEGAYFVEVLGTSRTIVSATELTFTAAEAEYAAGEQSITLTSAQGELFFTFEGAANTIAGKHTLGADATFGANAATGEVELIFNKIESNIYYYTVKTAFTANEVSYKSNNVLAINGTYAEDNTNIDVAMAIQLAEKLPSSTSSSKQPSDVTYNIYGYVANVVEDGVASYGNMTFWMSDDSNASSGSFEAYRVASAVSLKKGVFVKVTAQLLLYGSTTETSGGSVVVADPNNIPELRHGSAVEIDTVSADRAYQIGQELEGEVLKTVNSEKTYCVIGYVAKIKEAWTAEYKNSTFFLCNSDTATYGNFQVFRGKSDAAIPEHSKVMIVGKIAKYTYDDGEASIQMSQPNVTFTELPVPNDYTEGIREAVLEQKAAKVLVNGKLVIIRGNKRFDLVGAEF